jgi:hypothetical protein
MMDRLPSLTSLRAFAAVACHASVSRAAEELGVTQPAVTQQLRQLEAWLGLRLVQRAGAGIALTEAGAAYAVQVTEAFAALARATAALRTRGAESNVVTISLIGTFAQRWLIPRLPGPSARDLGPPSRDPRHPHPAERRHGFLHLQRRGLQRNRPLARPAKRPSDGECPLPGGQSGTAGSPANLGRA